MTISNPDRKPATKRVVTIVYGHAQNAGGKCGSQTENNEIAGSELGWSIVNNHRISTLLPYALLFCCFANQC